MRRLLLPLTCLLACGPDSGETTGTTTDDATTTGSTTGTPTTSGTGGSSSTSEGATSGSSTSEATSTSGVSSTSTDSASTSGETTGGTTDATTGGVTGPSDDCERLMFGEEDCLAAGCTPISGAPHVEKDGMTCVDFGTQVFLGCLAGDIACPPVVLTVCPEGQPDTVFDVPAGCLPPGHVMCAQPAPECA